MAGKGQSGSNGYAARTENSTINIFRGVHASLFAASLVHDLSLLLCARCVHRSKMWATLSLDMPPSFRPFVTLDDRGGSSKIVHEF